jgi:hypothetical protein
MLSERKMTNRLFQAISRERGLCCAEDRRHEPCVGMVEVRLELCDPRKYIASEYSVLFRVSR